MQQLQMQQKYLKSNSFISSFTPWNDDHEQELYNYKAAAKTIEETPVKPNTLRLKKFKNRQVPNEEAALYQTAKKTLLDLGHQQKESNTTHLRNYLIKKQSLKEQRQEEREFSLPSITRLKQPSVWSRDKMNLGNSNSLVMRNKSNTQNQEEIFKKYGEHRRSPSNSSLERNLGYAQGIISRRDINNEIRKQLETLEMSRQKSDFEPQLRQLKLNGKKVSCEKRKNKRREELEISFLPSQPNITPHYLLFSQNKEDIYKKIFTQLQYKGK